MPQRRIHPVVLVTASFPVQYTGLILPSSHPDRDSDPCPLAHLAFLDDQDPNKEAIDLLPACLGQSLVLRHCDGKPWVDRDEGWPGVVD